MIKSTPSLELQNWPLDRLIFYARNPRKNDSAVDRMCASLREFGFKIPVLARGDGEVVDGHLRLKAARKLGIAEIPVILCYEWTEAQVKAFRLLVNRSVAWADWDDELLSRECGSSRRWTSISRSPVSKSRSWTTCWPPRSMTIGRTPSRGSRKAR